MAVINTDFFAVSGNVPDTVIQDNPLIDEQRHGEKRHNIQDPPVFLDHPCRGEQEQCREDVSFVHLDAEYV